MPQLHPFLPQMVTQQQNFFENPSPRVDPQKFSPTLFLEELKASNSPLVVEQIRDVVFEMCTHKEASRLVQEKIT